MWNGSAITDKHSNIYNKHFFQSNKIILKSPVICLASSQILTCHSTPSCGDKYIQASVDTALPVICLSFIHDLVIILDIRYYNYKVIKSNDGFSYMLEILFSYSLNINYQLPIILLLESTPTFLFYTCIIGGQ